VVRLSATTGYPLTSFQDQLQGFPPPMLAAYFWMIAIHHENSFSNFL
jgi:hypothetical protein